MNLTCPLAGPMEMSDLALKMRLDRPTQGQIARALKQCRSTVRSWLRRQQEV